MLRVTRLPAPRWDPLLFPKPEISHVFGFQVVLGEFSIERVGSNFVALLELGVVFVAEAAIYEDIALVLGVFEEQAAGAHVDAIFLVTRVFALPEGLWHNAKHRAAIEAKGAKLEGM